MTAWSLSFPSPPTRMSMISLWARMQSLMESNMALTMGSDLSFLALSRSALNSWVWHWYRWRLATAPSMANRLLMRQ